MSGKITRMLKPHGGDYNRPQFDMNMFTQIVSGQDLRLGDTVIKSDSPMAYDVNLYTESELRQSHP